MLLDLGKFTTLAVVLVLGLTGCAQTGFQGNGKAVKEVHLTLREVTSAEKGEVLAQQIPGLNELLEKDAYKNRKKDLAWFLEAAENGPFIFQLFVGVCYKDGGCFVEGEEIPQDLGEAVRWLLRAAEEGYAGAQYELGVMYRQGHGVDRNNQTAVKWLQKAAEQGEASAQHNLGVHYEKGQGVPRDFPTAAMWYQRAAEQGLAASQANLGLMYAKGKGVEKDLNVAMKWTRFAANQGDSRAQTNLGGMYLSKNLQGEKDDQDLIEALMWFSLAAVQGNAKGEVGMKFAASKLTNSQIAEAERRAREWMSYNE